MDPIDCHRHGDDMRFGGIGFGPGETATREAGGTMSNDGAEITTGYGARPARQGGRFGKPSRTGSAVAGCDACGQRRPRPANYFAPAAK